MALSWAAGVVRTKTEWALYREEQVASLRVFCYAMWQQKLA